MHALPRAVIPLLMAASPMHGELRHAWRVREGKNTDTSGGTTSASTWPSSAALAGCPWSDPSRGTSEPRALGMAMLPQP